MAKKLLSILALVAGVAIIALWMINGYNNMVEMEEKVEAAWSHVENEYQRRMDMVEQVVSVVGAYASHEKETLMGVIEARAKATQVTIDPSKVTAEQLAEFQSAQGELNQALGRLMAVSEAYPELKADKQFLTLQSQIEGNENRCTIARDLYNDEARVFNTAVRRFPNNILANILGFSKKPYFEADKEAHHAPKIQF